jgi:chromosome segregation ATPase
MVDINKLKEQSGGQASFGSTGTSDTADIDKEIKLIADLPEVESSGDMKRAWFVRLVVGLFALVALSVLYLAYAESHKIEVRKVQLQVMEESTEKKREEHAQLTESIAGMREESTSLSASVGKLTQENNQLSYDLQNAQKTITLAEQRQVEVDDASARLATMIAEISATTTRSSTVTREIQALEARHEAELVNLESILKSIVEYSQTLSEKQPLVDEVNRLKPERDALRKEVERLQLTESKLMPLTNQVAALEDRKNRIDPTVAQLEISLKAAQTEFDSVRSKLAGEKMTLDETRRQRATIEGEVTALTKEVSTNQNALATAKSSLAVTLTSINSQEASNERLTADVARLQAQYDGFQLQIKASQVEFQTSDTQRLRLATEIDNQNTRLTSLKESAAKAEAEETALKRAVVKLQGEEAELTRGNAATDMSIATKKSELTGLNSQLEEASKSIAKIRAEAESLKAEVESMRLQKNTLVSEVSFAQGQRSLARETEAAAVESN